jgi:hypothetical protein
MSVLPNLFIFTNFALWSTDGLYCSAQLINWIVYQPRRPPRYTDTGQGVGLLLEIRPSLVLYQDCGISPQATSGEVAAS